MELNQLKYFQTIASAGSLTAAARLLGVSQPTLTVIVQHLEEELGTRLLLRGPRGVEITDTGRELLVHVREVFETLERARQRIHGLEEEERGAFTLGCHESLGAYFLPDFLAPFLAECPGIDITLWNHNSARVRQAVIDREIHFGLVVNPEPHAELVMMDLFPDQVTLFVAPGRIPPDASPEDARRIVADGPLIFAGRISQCQQIVDDLALRGLLPSRRLSCGDMELVKSLTARGIGVGILPERVAAYGARGRLTPLREVAAPVPDRIHLLFRGDLHRTRAARRLKDALLAYGQQLPPPAF